MGQEQRVGDALQGGAGWCAAEAAHIDVAPAGALGPPAGTKANG
jgi:hypothetical protein